MQQVAQEAAALFIALPLAQKRQKLQEIEQVNATMADVIRREMEKANDRQNREFIAQGQQAMQQQGGALPI